MINVRCLRCGVVNLVSDEVCKVCGADLQPAIAGAEIPPQADSDPSTRVYGDVIPPFEGASDGIGPTFHLFRKNLWLITKIIFVIIAPLEVFKALSVDPRAIDWQLILGLFALQLLANVLVVPALYYALLTKIQTGNAPSVNEAYRWSLGKFPKLLLASLISWIITVVGFMLLVIPGLILCIVFSLVYPIAVFEKGSAVDALRRSAQLTRGRRWNILGAYFVIWIVVVVISYAASGVASIFLLNGLMFWPLGVAIAIVNAIFAEALTVLSLVIYLGILRTLESGQSVIE
jgi:hypothetical protein